MPACLVVDVLRSGDLYTGRLGITISAPVILGAQFPLKPELDPAAAARQVESQVIDIIWFNVTDRHDRAVVIILCKWGI